MSKILCSATKVAEKKGKINKKEKGGNNRREGRGWGEGALFLCKQPRDLGHKQSKLNGVSKI